MVFLTLKRLSRNLKSLCELDVSELIKQRQIEFVVLEDFPKLVSKFKKIFHRSLGDKLGGVIPLSS